MSEKRQALEDKLHAYSKTLEQRVDERTSALRETEEKQRAILDGISDAVIVLDEDQNITWANDIAVKQYGAVIGRKCYEAYKWLEEPCSDCIARKTYSDGVTLTSEEEGILKGGTHVNFIVGCSPVRDPEGKVVSVVEVLHDFTERKRAEEQVKTALREKEELLGEIHHRVKNNLQIISSLLDLSSMRTQDPDAIDLFTDARSKINTMALIHSQLYQSTRFDQIDMASHIHELVGFLSQIYAARLITPVIECSGVYLPLTQAIPCALVTNELISNAYKHAFKMGQKGTIEVFMQQSAEGSIFLRVKDDGIGIPDEVDIYKTGCLGLKLVRNLVQQQLKGDIQVKRDKGTEFIIEFKIVNGAEVKMPKIMVVDDEVIITLQLEERLTKMGYDVVGRASSGEEAVEMARCLRPDLILMDIVMPGKLDGIEATEIIRGEMDISVIFLTAYADDKLVKRAKSVEPLGYIVKPFRETELQAMIEVALYKKTMERKLRESELRYRTLFESCPIGFGLSTKEGKILECNDVMLQMTGYSGAELLQVNLRDTYRNPEEHALLLKRLQTDGCVRDFEVGLKRKDGTPYYASLTITPFTLDGGDILLTVALDITERKLANHERSSLLKELEVKNAELERFAYTVSHDLKSPLISIQGFAELLREDLKRDEKEKAESDLEYIKTAATKMERLMNDTLQLSRIGRVVNPPEDVPFGEIAQEALEQAVAEIKSSGVDVSVVEDFPTVHVDRMRMVEVLVNLITNSINYMGEQSHPKIEIGFRTDGEKTVFFVKDNGIGIDKSQHEKVFELFYKEVSSSKGTGAGLAIVKRIIEVHNGRIWIESDKGKGCTVCFTLPLS